MKLTIQRKVLAGLIKQCLSVVQDRSTLQALRCVLLDAEEDGSLKLTASNLYNELSVTAQASEVEKHGRALVNARALAERVDVFPDGLIHLVCSDNNLTIRAGNRRHTLYTLDTGDFPSTAIEPIGQTFGTVPVSALRACIAATKHAVSQDRSRLNLIGVWLEMHDGKLRGVGMNGHVLAVRDVEVPNARDCGKLMVQPGSLSALDRAIDGAENVEVFFEKLEPSGKRLWLRTEHSTFTSEASDDAQPPYGEILKRFADQPNYVFVSRDELAAAARSAELAAGFTQDGDPIYNVDVEIGKDRVFVTSKSQQSGEAEDEVEADVHGKPTDIRLNAHYVLAALRSLSGERVRVSYGEPLDPVFIREIDSDHNTHVIMPAAK